MMMYKAIPIILPMFIALTATAQQAEIDTYNQQRVKISRAGLYNLAGWSALNFGVSGAGWASTEGATREFHRANVTWNMVNVAIAVPGIISSYRKSSANFSLNQTHKEQRKAEGAYLINGILDASYIGMGLYLRERSKNTSKDANRMKGWGNALLLQGGFLLLTDLVMYSWHSAHANRKLDKIEHSIGFHGNGFGYAMTFK
jgi:hypothetical protein